jgi:hypothetical protein
MSTICMGEVVYKDHVVKLECRLEVSNKWKC